MAEGCPTLTVIAGPNGAGKSSVVGALLGHYGGSYFNPDEWASALRRQDPTLSQSNANARAWTAGKEALEQAIVTRRDYTFETTLGGNTIPLLISRAAARGYRVVVWYVGLDSPETHVERVHQRVSRGGHDIPQAKIRERFDRSLENLITLLPAIDELRFLDNSATVQLETGEAPRPKILLHFRAGRVIASVRLEDVPNWAKPVFAAILVEGS